MLAGLGKIKGASLGSSGSARFSGFREFLPGRRTAAGGAAPKEPKIFLRLKFYLSNRENLPIYFEDIARRVRWFFDNRQLQTAKRKRRWET